MSTKQEDSIRPEIVAEIDRALKGQSGNSSTSPPPASGSSGSQGTGSGSSGATGSGGSPPSDSSGSSNSYQGGQRPMTTADQPPPASGEWRKTVRFWAILAIGTVILVAGIVNIISMARYSSFSTTPQGIAVREAVRKSEDQRHTQEHEERMADKALLAKRIDERREMRARQSAPTTREMSPPITVCASVGRTREILGRGACLEREATEKDFWLVLEGKPKSISGTVWFNQIENGKLQDYCRTSQSSDQCVSWLSSKLGIPLSVTHSGRMKIST